MKKKLLAMLAIALIITATFTSCASGDRIKKSLSSDFGGGINREIIVYSATGEEIWRFEGKFDISYSESRLLFDDEDNIRHCIYLGGGTVIVNEL